MVSLPAIKIQSLSKTYDNGFAALQGVSFDIAQGDFFALLGENGAGKSTLIGILTSLVRKTSGKVWIQGLDIDEDFRRAKALIGVVPQDFNFSVFETPWSILLNQAGYYGIARKQAAERATHYLQAMDLWEKRHQIARFLSGGMKRRLMIARALVHDPSILILDEPTAGVDVHIRQAIWSFLKDLNAAGKTIILTTHYFEEAEQLCRHVAWLHKGCVLEQAPMSDLLATLPLERFYLHLAGPLAAVPDLAGYQLSLQTPTCLLVALQQRQDITTLLSALANQGVIVERIVNEKNRLEALFMTRLAALQREQIDAP